MNKFAIAQAYKNIQSNGNLSTHQHIIKQYDPDTDLSTSQRYFDAVFRFGPGVIGIENDLVVLQDPQTPDIMKQYIMQHSAKVVSSTVSSPYGEQSLDDLMPSNLQTYGEVREYIDNNNLNII